MWLLETRTYELKYFIDHRSAPHYAILSHTWSDDEVSFADMDDMAVARSKKGFEKIQRTWAVALADGFEYAWVDTCCIDKKRSAELAEAINSMLGYYGRAVKCYVYLADLADDCPDLRDGVSSGIWCRAFKSCRWFTRGWTLQELIASRELQFHSSAWRRAASLNDMILTISERTTVPVGVLLRTDRLSNMSIARRMSWAAWRETTRIEDRAYSLLGIFDVNMPLLYGEGPKAFLRLQSELLKKTTDHSILIWQCGQHVSGYSPALATDPDDFADCGDISPASSHESFAIHDTLELTSMGLRLTVSLKKDLAEYMAVLNCRFKSRPGHIITLRLVRSEMVGRSDVYHTYKYKDDEGTSSRLTSTPRALVQPPAATRTTILLSNHQSSQVDDYAHPRLWLQIAPTCPLRIVEAFPDLWNHASGTMAPLRDFKLPQIFAARSRLVTAVVLEHCERKDDTRITLGFMFPDFYPGGPNRVKYHYITTFDGGLTAEGACKLLEEVPGRRQLTFTFKMGSETFNVQNADYVNEVLVIKLTLPVRNKVETYS